MAKAVKCRGKSIKLRCRVSKVRHYRLRLENIEFLAEWSFVNGRTQAGQLDFLLDRERLKYKAKNS